ncbi:MAG TPA: sugar phosphate isomerase/epimerase family protein [Gemmataceae bacterium]|nr:sugar phosphate isomerase/epimerase family protein [Gemmataceae bacterium]
MIGNRRQFLAAAAALPFAQALAGAADEDKRKRLGVVQYSYALRLAADRAAGKTGFNDPLAFVEHCRELGAGGVQTAIGLRDKDYLAKLRKKVEDNGMDLEGTIRLPKDRMDLDRFTAETRAARDAGAKVLRTVLMGGRRYEQFTSIEDFRAAADRAEKSVKLAEPVVAKHDMLLAIENHKDYRTGELLALLKRLDSRNVGVCVDTGNSIALLEDPLEVVRQLAPRAFTVHLKDMAVAEYEDGFLLAEVPLGEGFLDLPKMVRLLREARPDIRFNLEMITRDPLRVPCLSDKYWATAANVSGRTLARTLALVRKHKQALPHISGRSQKEQLAMEEENVRKSLVYARKHLEL